MAAHLKSAGVLIKKINLSNERISVLNSELTKALHSNKKFAITLAGEIRYAPFDPVDIFIYQGKGTEADQHSLSTSRQDLLGPHYKVDKEDERILIDAEDAWLDIIKYNASHCDFYNTPAEGVTQFSDEEIEDMGWMIIDFDVSYAELMKMLEEKTAITFVGVKSKEPDRFNGMGFFNDIPHARKVLFDFCRDIIEEKLSKDADYALELLDEDQREALEYFKLI